MTSRSPRHLLPAVCTGGLPYVIANVIIFCVITLTLLIILMFFDIGIGLEQQLEFDGLLLCVPVPVVRLRVDGAMISH